MNNSETGMHNRFMTTSAKELILPLVLLATATSLYAQGTAFTYHGRLNQNGSPATGNYDLRFTIYDAAGGLGIVAGPLTQGGVGITNGLFTTTLDFGANIFTGPGRWLEIMTRTNGAATFTPLKPRQLLTPTPYAIHAGSASDVASGSVVKSLNNLRDNVSLLAGANVTLTPNGNTLTIASTGSGGSNGVWSINGANAFYNAGHVGIGTSAPARKLTVHTAPTDYGIEHTDGNVRLDTFVSSAGGFLGTVSDHKLHLFVNDGAARLTVDTSGAVGIGTVDPVSRLTVAGAGAFNSPLAAGLTLHNTAAARSWQWHALDDGRLQLADFTAGATRMMFDLDGNLGLGTLSPASKLDIAAQDALRITGPQPFLTLSDSAGFGLIRKANRYLQVVEGDLAFLYRPECNTFPCPTTVENQMTIRFNGLVGIGTSTPAAKLHLYHGPDSVSHRIETGGGINAWSRTEYNNANGQWVTGTSRGFNGDQFYIHRVGTPGISFGIQPNGDTRVQGTLTCNVLTITGGADLAEPFQMSEDEIPKGAVVVIDEENPGHLKMSAEAYDKRVAGVVSGANGIKPGISLHQEGALEGGENVALSGRVYVQADATENAIKPGDLLTTSGTPGHAMKVTDHTKAQGAILGKAMTGLKEGRGTVLMLVTLQ